MLTGANFHDVTSRRPINGGGFRRGLAIFAGVAAAVAFTPPVASARHDAETTPAETSPAGLYLTASATLGDVNDPDTSVDLQIDLGAELGLALGVGYRRGPFRVEGQYQTESFPLNNLNPGAGSTLPPGDYQGSLSSRGLMASGYYDFGTTGSTRPYIGAGIGFARLKPDYREPPNCWLLIFGIPQCVDGQQVVTGGDTVTAWQAMAGLTLASSNPRGEWFLGYRYFETAEASFHLADGTPFTQDGIRAQSFQIGYRYNLGGRAN